MKLTAIVFKPSCQLKFTKLEIDLLMRLSAKHYDAHCREVGEAGGFLFGLRNTVMFKSEDTLLFREIDTLCKILEIGHMTKADEKSGDYEASLRLAEQLRDCLHRLNNVCGMMQEIR